MTDCILRAVAIFVAVIGISPAWLYAQPAAQPTPAATPNVTGQVPVVNNAEANSLGEVPRSQRVRLGIDGNVVGRVSVYDASGQRRPVRVRIVLAQNGRIVTSDRSNEWGRFQLTNARPGVYALLAVGRAGFGAIPIRVLPYSAKASKDQAGNRGESQIRLAALASNENESDDDAPSSLDITLVPLEDSNLWSNLLSEEVPVSPQATAPGVSSESGGSGGGSGGGGGGGGGLGGLLGAAGLGVGIAALGDNGNGQGGGVASPFQPQ